MSRISFEVIEADSGAQEVKDGKLFVACDCGYNDKCPQGKPRGAERLKDLALYETFGKMAERLKARSC